MGSRSLSEWNHLHPASVGVNLIPQTWRFVRSMWPILVALLAGRSSGGTRFDVPMVIFALLSTVGRTLMHFLTLRYRVSEEGLEIKSGWLHRQTRILPPDRIQNVELVRNPFHRLSGLVEVRIETASGNEVEGELSALSVAEGERLVRTLKQMQRTKNEEPSSEKPQSLNHLSPWDLFKFAATSTRLGAILLVAGVAFEGLQGLDARWITTVGEQLSGSLMWVMVLATITGSWLVGLGVTMARHYGFHLQVHDGQLIAQEGLLTKRRIEIHRNRVQLLVHNEPFLRRLAGFGSLWIDTAAIRRGSHAAARAEAFIPVVERPDVHDLVSRTLPRMQLEEALLDLKSPHPNALMRARLASFWKIMGLTLAMVWAFGPWGWITPILGLPIEWFLTSLDHQHQGWLVTPQYVVTRSGYLNRRTHIIPRYRLQSTEVIQGPLLRQWGLGQLVLRVAGNAVSLPLITQEQARTLQTQLTYPSRLDHTEPPT